MDAYEVLGGIGEGTYGVVIRARHKATGQVVAIKRFKESEEDEQTRKTSLREVRVLKQLHHDNVVGLLDVFRRKGRLHLVFEYIERTILEVLDASPKGIDPTMVKKYMFQLLRGLDFCHSRNIIHRDVKPENILISEKGTLKLCDFGFARPMVSGGRYTDYVATRWYRAPELLVGDVEYGRGVDVWAVGCIFAEISNGLPLFPGESDLDQLAHVMRCVGKIPQRFVQIFYKNSLYRNVDLPPMKITESLDVRFPHAPGPWLHFIKACLRCDPADRETCAGLLGAAYFADTDDFTKAGYELALRNLYGDEEARRAQLLATIPPPAGGQAASAGAPPPAAVVEGKPKRASPPPPATQPQPVLPSHPPQGQHPPASSALWAQYLVSAAHELPDLGGGGPSTTAPHVAHAGGHSHHKGHEPAPAPVEALQGALPSLGLGIGGNAGREARLSEPPGDVSSGGAALQYAVQSGTAPEGSLPHLHGGPPPLHPTPVGHYHHGAYTSGQKSSAQTNAGPSGAAPSGVYATKTTTKRGSTPSEVQLNGLGTSSSTGGPQLGVYGTSNATANKASPTNSGSLAQQLAYKKKPHKRNVLSSLSFTAFGPGGTASGAGGGPSPAPTSGGVYNTTHQPPQHRQNTGLDPFAGGPPLVIAGSSTLHDHTGRGLPALGSTQSGANPTASSLLFSQHRRESGASGLPSLGRR